MNVQVWRWFDFNWRPIELRKLEPSFIRMEAVQWSLVQNFGILPSMISPRRSTQWWSSWRIWDTGAKMAILATSVRSFGSQMNWALSRSTHIWLQFWQCMTMSPRAAEGHGNTMGTGWHFSCLQHLKEVGEGGWIWRPMATSKAGQFSGVVGLSCCQILQTWLLKHLDG